MGRPSSSPLSRVPFAPLICFVVAAMVGSMAFPTALEWRSLDARSVMRRNFQKPPLHEISVLAYGDTANKEIEPWPPDRKWHAQLLKFLAASKVSVVSWDVIFDAPGASEAGDQLMARVAGAMNRINIPVLSGAVADDTGNLAIPDPDGLTHAIGRVEGDTSLLMGESKAVLPYPLLRENSRFAFVNTPPGPDGVRREVPLVVRVGHEVYPTLGLATALAHLRVDPRDVLVRLGDAVQFSSGDRLYRIPITSTGTYFVNYRYDLTPSGADFQYGEYFGTLTALEARLVEKDLRRDVLDFKGGIVFVAQMVEGKADAGPTPLGSNSPLAFIHANVVDNILKGDFMRRASLWNTCLGLAALTYLGYNLMVRRSAKTMALIAVAGVVLYIVFACAAWILWSLWIPIVAPLGGLVALNFQVILVRFMAEQRAKETMKAMFQSYLSPELLAKLLKQGGLLDVRSERRPVTILFSDLRGFTAWSERVGEEELIAQLNEYLEAMVECIHAEGGSLHKFIGDAIMAAWGDLDLPGLETPQACCRGACAAALRMQERLKELNATWQAAGREPLKMGIGINQGLVLVGNVGHRRKMEFTLIGDAVNLASRLESLTKEYKAEVLVGESVKDLAGDEFLFTPLGEIPVRGKIQPVAVYEVRGR